MYPSFNARALGLSLSGTETLSIASEAGFSGIDLLVRDLVESGEDLAALRREMDARGLKPGAFPLPMDWRGDEPTYRRGLERLAGYADAAAELGLTRTGTWVMPETPEGPSDPRRKIVHLESVAALHRERLGAIAGVLARRSIRLGLEVIGVRSSRTGGGLPFVTRLGDLESRLGPIGEIGPNVGILVDAFHLYAAGESIDRALVWGVGSVVWVHLADLPSDGSANLDDIVDHDRGLPGELGVVDNAGLIARLKALNYEGPLTVEPLAGCRTLQGLTPTEKAKAAYKAIPNLALVEHRG